jgi:phosphoadenosine phosphosulfate reductase
MDLEKISIERLREGAQMSELYYQKPLLLCYSGGKDSEIIVDLALKSGIDFEVQHSHTTADAPETVYHVRKRFKGLENKGIKCTINKPFYKDKRTSMWDLIPKIKMPPTRLMRYCCSVLKETAGRNRCIVTGVRRAESIKRKSAGVIETRHKNINKRIIINNDNDEKRQIVERCQMQSKIAYNIIADWDNETVKDYIDSEHINCNPLYQCGFNRVGCIGCPMAGKIRKFEFARYPKYRDLYIRAFDKMIKVRKAENKDCYSWHTGLDVFHWWMEDGVLPGQMTIDGEIDW